MNDAARALDQAIYGTLSPNQHFSRYVLEVLAEAGWEIVPANLVNALRTWTGACSTPADHKDWCPDCGVCAGCDDELANALARHDQEG